MKGACVSFLIYDTGRGVLYMEWEGEMDWVRNIIQAYWAVYVLCGVETGRYMLRRDSQYWPIVFKTSLPRQCCTAKSYNS